MSLRLLRPRLGQLLVVACTSERVPVELRVLAREFDLGGVLCHAGSVVETLQLADLARDIQTLAHEIPLWTGVWPGQHVSVPPLTDWPPLASLGRADSRELSTAYATQRARECLALGLTLDLGPVVDLTPDATGAADAALGDDAARVARHAAWIVEAMGAAGLATCARHFPGLASAVTERALPCPLIEAPPDHLEAVDWQPFRAVISAGVPAVLVAHVLVPGLDERAPAAQSRVVVRDVLRGRLGFTGTIFGDDPAPAPDVAHEEPATVVRTLAAGCDVLLSGGTLDHVAQMLEQIVRAAERDALFVRRLEDALGRQETMKASFLSEAGRRRRPPPPSLAEALVSGEGERVAERMRAFE